MELTRRQLIEDFKPYKVRQDRKWIEADAKEFGNIYSCTVIKELILRDLDDYTFTLFVLDPCWEPYDLNEEKPYIDGSVQQINRLMDSISPQNLQHTYPSWQMSEAKLELINRN